MSLTRLVCIVHRLTSLCRFIRDQQSPKLGRYKLIPLCSAQLVNVNECLALSGTPGDIRERRRIEIRLRKSAPQQAAVADKLPPRAVRLPGVFCYS